MSGLLDLSSLASSGISPARLITSLLRSLLLQVHNANAPLRATSPAGLPPQSSSATWTTKQANKHISSPVPTL